MVLYFLMGVNIASMNCHLDKFRSYVVSVIVIHLIEFPVEEPALVGILIRSGLKRSVAFNRLTGVSKTSDSPWLGRHCSCEIQSRRRMR
jgi:hypothetical protein